MELSQSDLTLPTTRTVPSSQISEFHHQPSVCSCRCGFTADKMPTATDLLLNSFAVSNASTITDIVVATSSDDSEDNELDNNDNSSEKNIKKKQNGILVPDKKLLEEIKCGYHSFPDRMQHEQFFQRSVELLLNEAVFKGTDRYAKVCNWKSPEELRKTFDFTLQDGCSTQPTLLHYLKMIIEYSVKTGHPYFMNQLFSSVDPYGLVAQWLGDALNSSVYTYEVAPVFTLMEETVLLEIRKLIGFQDGDGIFSPGGSIANGYAISCARFHKFPQIKTQGLHGLPRLVIFASEQAHYSVKKLAAFEGLGSDNVYNVSVDDRGKMDVADLERQIIRSLQENAVPMMVLATAGTTVLGAYDPITEIVDICSRYKIWLHVDAAWGGAVMFSKRYRYLIKNIERADSVTFNPHKMLAAPQQCSTFVTRHSNILNACHSCSAQYLFQKDKFYDTSFDTGDKHIQCGRRADVLKIWFMWKAKGKDGLEAHVNHVFDVSRYFVERIRERPEFRLVLNLPECTNVCFWYIPKNLQGKESERNYKERLNSVAPELKRRMMLKGSMMITYQPLNDLPNFFRLVVQNSALNYKDMDYIIEEFGRLAVDLE